MAGQVVTLVPLRLEHSEPLHRAAIEDRSSYDFTPVPSTITEMVAYVEARLRSQKVGETVPFAVRLNIDGRLVGCTRFDSPRYSTGSDGTRSLLALEIGGSWLSSSVQGKGVNWEAKLLLLSHAFDVLGVERVELRSDARNLRSRKAMVRIGATLEGVLRHYQPSFKVGEGGRLRDTALYSIIRPEWALCRLGLEALVESVAAHHTRTNEVGQV